MPVQVPNQNSRQRIPFCSRRAAVMPVLGRTPQEGLRALSRASRISWALAMASTWRAPRRNCSVRSVPCRSITLAVPARTAKPSPPTRSAAVRGVGRPPSCSGQTGIQWYRCSRWRHAALGLLPPSYLVQSPVRQALTRQRGRRGPAAARSASALVILASGSRWKRV